MANKLKQLSIGKNRYINFDIIVYDRQESALIFASLLDNDSELKKNMFDLNQKNSIYLKDRRTYISSVPEYVMDKRKQSGSDFAHLVINKKDYQDEIADDERTTCYIYMKSDDNMSKSIFDKLYKYTSIPIIEEWMDFLIDEFYEHEYLKELRVEHIYDEQPLWCYKLQITNHQLLELVQQGLKDNRISINNQKESSSLMSEIKGIDAYLNIFGETLAQKIQTSFVPKFNPKIDDFSAYVNYFDDYCFSKGIELYKAQKATIQSMVNNLNKNDVGIIVGEMGIGKSLIGAGITYAHYKKKIGMTNLVMCPGHLVNKWKKEIEKTVPNGKGYIIKTISDVIALDSKIRSKTKLEHTFLIISKESAKFSYETYPTALWSKSKNAFVCPTCGKILTKKVKNQTTRRYEIVPLSKEDFRSQLVINRECSECHDKLWAPLNKNSEKSKWIKIGSEGWYYIDHLQDLIDSYSRNPSLTQKERKLFRELVNVKFELDSGEKRSIRAPRKFSVSKYIKKYYKGMIDYLLLDELHLYSAESKQGQAMENFVKSAKKVIGLTGTLLNGYADSLYYILYRCYPRMMKEFGFKYSDVGAFMHEYGVTRKTGSYNFEGSKLGTSREKRLPGVSPLVFTNFLLESTAFISLSDIEEGGLPSYEEIPVSVEMDSELRTNYDNLERNLRESCGRNRGMKIMGSLLQALSVYPDTPYNQPPIIHPDTGEVLVTPPQLESKLRNKELKLLELVKEKIDAGEKVLIYNEWTNKSDVAEKIKSMLLENNIDADILSASDSSSSDRENFINKKLESGLQVLICNPKLVETGLDLLEFTTIIFYQIGYNVSTLRQASRRSYRLNQTKGIKVYFMYYENTIQDKALSLMATKLQASMAIEGKFSEEGLRAMSNNEDLMTEIANSVVSGMEGNVQASSFSSIDATERKHDTSRERIDPSILLVNIVEPILLYETPKAKKVSKKTKGAYDLLSGNTSLGNF